MVQGSLSLALVGKDGVVLAGERRDRSPLLAPGPSPKIGALDKHVAYVMSGIAPDGRYLVRRGRLLSQVGGWLGGMLDGKMFGFGKHRRMRAHHQTLPVTSN